MPAKEKTPRATLTRADLVVLAALIAAALFVGLVAHQAPSIAGMYADDGIYLVTGKALAEGRGYRHLELPGEPLQTKYPPLYPLVLSVIWRLWADFPANMAAVQLLNLACWLVGSWFAYRLLRHAWALPWWLPAAGVLVTFLNPLTEELIGTAMSEPLFFALSMAALLLVVRLGRQTTPRASGWAWSVPAGLLAAGAYLTRSIGITLAVALVLGAALRRRWKETAVLVLVTGLAVGGWQVWSHSAARRNAELPAYDTYRYDLDYSAWMTTDPATLARVAYYNTGGLALGLFREITAIPVGWVDRLLERGPAAAWYLYLALGLIVAFLLAGLVHTWRRDQPELHLYLVIYLGLILIWPFESTRFLAPIQPMLTTLVLAGLYRTAVFVARRFSGSQAKSGADPWAAGLPGAELGFRLVVILALVFGYMGVRSLLAIKGSGLAGEPAPPTEALVPVLRDRTPPEAVALLGESRAGYLYLRTGRRCVTLAPPAAPLAFSYASDRPWHELGRRMTPKGYLAFRAWLGENLLKYGERTGARYLITPAEGRSGSRIFADLTERFPGHVEPLAEAGPYRVFRLLVGSAGEAAP